MLHDFSFNPGLCSSVTAIVSFVTAARGSWSCSARFECPTSLFVKLSWWSDVCLRSPRHSSGQIKWLMVQISSTNIILGYFSPRRPPRKFQYEISFMKFSTTTFSYHITYVSKINGRDTRTTTCLAVLC